jgi:hypothetical protein
MPAILLTLLITLMPIAYGYAPAIEPLYHNPSISSVTLFRLQTYLAESERALIDYHPQACQDILSYQQTLALMWIKLFFSEQESCQSPESNLCELAISHLKAKFLDEKHHPEILPIPDGWNIPQNHRQVFSYFNPCIVQGLCIPPPQAQPSYHLCSPDTLRYRRSLKQKQAIVAWADIANPRKGGRVWIHLVDDYLKRQPLTVQEKITIRAILATALHDAAQLAFRLKYHYLIKRPCEKGIPPVDIPCPLSPAYPSIHAALGGAAEAIMCFYFPHDRAYWKELSHECADSRIWAGVHFYEDIKAGRSLGYRVGENRLTHPLNPIFCKEITHIKCDNIPLRRLYPRNN